MSAPVAAARLVVPRGNEIDDGPRSRGDSRVGSAAHRAIGRNVGLDAIRLAAAGLVFVSHAALASGIPGSWAIVNAGGVGVALFFVLSGYLIPTVWASRPDRTYWLRRAARILPAYWLAVIALGLATGVPITAATLAMIQPIDLNQFDTFLGVAWTLRLELIFYALVPLVARLPLRWILGLGAVSLVLMAIVHDPQRAGTFPFRFWMFVPGIVLARRAPRGALPWAVAMLGAALVVLAVLAGELLPGVAGAGLLVAVALSRPWRVPRWIVYGSTISYGVYLWHHEIVRALRDVGLPPVAIALGGLALTLAAAAASWHLLEQPVNRLAASAPALYAVRRNSMANSSAK